MGLLLVAGLAAAALAQGAGSPASTGGVDPQPMREQRSIAAVAQAKNWTPINALPSSYEAILPREREAWGPPEGDLEQSMQMLDWIARAEDDERAAAMRLWLAQRWSKTGEYLDLWAHANEHFDWVAANAPREAQRVAAEYGYARAHLEHHMKSDPAVIERLERLVAHFDAYGDRLSADERLAESMYRNRSIKLLADSYLRANRLDDAIGRLAQLAGMGTDELRGTYGGRAIDVHRGAMLTHARTLARVGRYEEAQQSYDQIEKAYGDDPRFGDSSVWFVYERLNARGLEPERDRYRTELAALAARPAGVSQVTALMHVNSDLAGRLGRDAEDIAGAIEALRRVDDIATEWMDLVPERELDSYRTREVHAAALDRLATLAHRADRLGEAAALLERRLKLYPGMIGEANARARLKRIRRETP